MCKCMGIGMDIRIGIGLGTGLCVVYVCGHDYRHVYRNAYGYLSSGQCFLPRRYQLQMIDDT